MKHVQSRFALILALLGASCGQAPEEDPTAPIAVESAQFKLLGPEQLVMWDGTRALSEPAAAAVITADGTTELINVSNDGNTPQYGTQRIYSCTRNNGTSWQTWWTNGLVNQGDDSSVVGTRNASPPGSTARVYQFNLLTGTNGFRLWWTADPCPPSGNPAWFFINLARTQAVDYPKIIYNRDTQQLWATWNEITPADGLNKIFVARVGEGGFVTTPVANTCGGTNTNRTLQFANADYTRNNDLIVVFLDRTGGQVKTQKFNVATNSWDCGSIKTLGTMTFPTNTCATCDRGTYNNLDNACLRGTFNPSIAIHRDVLTNHDFMIATYTTQAVDASCPTMQEVRWYRNTDYGNWVWQTRTGCTMALQPRTIEGGAGAGGGIFHTMESHRANGMGQLAQVDWRSLDNGNSWSGAFMTGARASNGPITGCYWGDYNGATWGDVNNSARMYYNWTNFNAGVGVWGIHGITNDQ